MKGTGLPLTDQHTTVNLKLTIDMAFLLKAYLGIRGGGEPEHLTHLHALDTSTVA